MSQNPAINPLKSLEVNPNAGRRGEIKIIIMTNFHENSFLSNFKVALSISVDWHAGSE